MLIAGLDLASEPKGTALALLDWSRGRVKLERLQLGVTDFDVVELAPKLSKLGIDCALGWPNEFVQFLSTFATETLATQKYDGGIDWRRQLAYRETDREVHKITGRWPLSVSTDRLAMTALRCAGLLTKLEAAGEQVDRSGIGKIVEVYPAASLRIWGLSISGYRTSSKLRGDLLSQLTAAATWLDLGGFEPLMIESCDVFDAVIAALAAGSAATGHSTTAPDNKAKIAKIEGWVALPKGSLAELG